MSGQEGPYTGAELLGVITSNWKVEPGSAIQWLGEPVVMGGTQVAVPVRVIHRVSLADRGNGVVLFNLRTEDGELKVTEVIWLSSR